MEEVEQEQVINLVILMDVVELVVEVEQEVVNLFLMELVDLVDLVVAVEVEVMVVQELVDQEILHL